MGSNPVRISEVRIPVRVVSVRYGRRHYSGEETRVLPELWGLERKRLRGEYRIILDMVLTIALGDLIPCWKVGVKIMLPVKR
jgi:hypothetical protein